jgi:hypothetical protein
VAQTWAYVLLYSHVETRAGGKTEEKAPEPAPAAEDKPAPAAPFSFFGGAHRPQDSAGSCTVDALSATVEISMPLQAESRKKRHQSLLRRRNRRLLRPSASLGVCIV